MCYTSAANSVYLPDLLPLASSSRGTYIHTYIHTYIRRRACCHQIICKKSVQTKYVFDLFIKKHCKITAFLVHTQLLRAKNATNLRKNATKNRLFLSCVRLFCKQKRLFLSKYLYI